MSSALRFILLPATLAGFLLTASCKEGNSSSTSSTTSATETEAAGNTDEAAPAGDFYKRYEGMLAGKPVVLNLCRYNGNMEGYYQYTGVSQALRLTGWEDTTRDEAYYLTEMVPGDYSDASAHWEVRLEGSHVKGRWTGVDGQKTYDLDLQERYPEGSYRLNAFYMADSARLSPSQAREEPHAIITAAALEAVGADAPFINRQIAKLMGDEEESGLKASIRKGMTDYLSDYKTENAEYASDTDMIWTLNHTNDDWLYMVYNTGGWLVLERLSGMYTGGAHGGSSMTYLNLDVRNKKEWTLTDVFADTSNLYKLLDGPARRRSQSDAKTGSLEDAGYFVERIPVTDNFFILPEGITFVYGEYEIASYADGIIPFYLPWKSVAGYLRPEFKARMGL